MSKLAARMRCRQTAQNEGQAIVEMAFVISLLLVLAFGVMDAGLFMYKYVQAANCTREVARRAVVRDLNPGNVPACGSWNIQPVYSDPAQSAGTEVSATIDEEHNWLVLPQFLDLLVPGDSDFAETVRLYSKTSMRLEAKKI